MRVGLRFVADADAELPEPFSYLVGDRLEAWEEGLVMAHNPHAVLPLPDDTFPGIVHLPSEVHGCSYESVLKRRFRGVAIRL